MMDPVELIKNHLLKAVSVEEVKGADSPIFYRGLIATERLFHVSLDSRIGAGLYYAFDTANDEIRCLGEAGE